ncbi:acyl-CoA dehydrogenase family protein [Chloroflexota bacterium]
MDSELTEEQKQIQKICREIALEFKPYTDEANKTNETFPPEIDKKAIRRLRENKLLGLGIPEEYGGIGGPFLNILLAAEEFCTHAPRNYLAAHVIDSSAAGVVMHFLDIKKENLKKRFVPKIINRELKLGLSMAEPLAGSALTDLTTTATEDGDHYILNGIKRWGIWGGVADFYYVYARLGNIPGGRGIMTFIVDKDTPGISFGRDWGFWGVDTGCRRDVIFRDCRVPKENVVTEAGELGKALARFNSGRLQDAACTLGYARGSLDDAIAYSKERMQFGKPLCEFQMIQDMLADMVMKVEASRGLIYRAGATVKSGTASPLLTSIAKAYCNQAAVEVCDRACQIYGACGFVRGFPVEWRYSTHSLQIILGISNNAVAKLL